jgi:phosphoenolpyruvate carboxykinase (ATP)
MHKTRKCKRVSDDTLNPHISWNNEEAYLESAKKLARLFVENFKQYEGSEGERMTAYGPNI